MQAGRWARWTWLLFLDEASVMVGAQFREVALATLMFSLWPSPKSYALAIMATLIPSAVCGRWVGALADRWSPKFVLVGSYILRAAALTVIAEAHAIAPVLIALVVLSLGTAVYVGGMSHYQAQESSVKTRTLLGRLRMVNGAVRLTAPLAAGALITGLGLAFGFWIGVACYGVALLAMAALPRSLGRADPTPEVAAGGIAPIWPQALKTRAWILAVLNGLMWIANVLYSAYILVDLKAGPIGFAISYALWGGAGLVAGALLQKLDMTRLVPLVTFGSLATTAGAWALMTYSLSFWPVAGLGALEGMVTWLLMDTLQAELLSAASSAVRGAWRGQLESGISRGRVAGLAAAICLPVFQHVHRGFLVLAVGSLVLMAMAGVQHWGSWSGQREGGRGAWP